MAATTSACEVIAKSIPKWATGEFEVRVEEVSDSPRGFADHKHLVYRPVLTRHKHSHEAIPL